MAGRIIGAPTLRAPADSWNPLALKNPTSGLSFSTHDVMSPIGQVYDLSWRRRQFWLGLFGLSKIEAILTQSSINTARACLGWRPRIDCLHGFARSCSDRQG